MAHTLLFSGYGAPGCDDLAVCRLTADGTLETLSTLRHGRAPSFCCRGQNGWIYAASERGDGADVTAYVLDGTTCLLYTSPSRRPCARLPALKFLPAAACAICMPAAM